MNIARQIGEHRPVVVLIVLVALSLASLITGAEATFIHVAIKRAVSLTVYPFLKVKHSVEKAADYTFNLVFNYDAVHRENAALRQNVATLKAAVSRRAELHDENRRLRQMMDFMRSQPRLTLEPAAVIESYKGMLRIDRGSLHGIRESMAVVTEDGVVGVVIEVDAVSAVVATLHHPECKIGAMVMRNRLRAYDGVIHASGSDLSRICTMDYIDMKNDVRVGDMVVASPESLFPSGYPIGVVSAPPHESGSLWKTAEIAPAVDPYRLDAVFVVRQAMPEPEELAAPPGPVVARSPSKAPELPDNRPIQERYAP